MSKFDKKRYFLRDKRCLKCRSRLRRSIKGIDYKSKKPYITSVCVRCYSIKNKKYYSKEYSNAWRAKNADK